MQKAEAVVSFALVLTLLFSSFGIAGAVDLTISTNKGEYDLSELVAITGKTDPRKVVSIQVFNPSGDLVAIAQTQADANGNFQENLFRFPEVSGGRYPFGNYTIKATTEGATTEIKIRFKQAAQPPPPPPPPPQGQKVAVESIPDRYIFTNKYGQLVYRLEVFKTEPKMSVAVEASPGSFDDANKVTSKLARLIEFTDANNNDQYEFRTDTDVKRIDHSELTWTNQLVNQSITKWQYLVILRGVKDAISINMNITIAGGDGNATVSLRLAGFSFSNPNSKLAVMWEGKAAKELDIGPGEFGINIRKDATFTSPFYRFEANGIADGNNVAFRSRIAEETEDIHEPDAQKLIYVTVPRFTTAATQKSFIGARVGVPVPEFPPIGIVLTFVILISAVFIMRRKGSPVFATFPK
jgi:hypothetical protein